MPGLAGIISKKKPELCERQLRTMLVSMQHEDFYDYGSQIHPEMSAYIGWVCHPKSFNDSASVIDLAKEVVLYFSGEVFSDQSSSPHGGLADGTGSVTNIVQLYKKHQEHFVDKLNGWFCGLLLDKQRGNIILFNDRYGMHRIFVYEGSDGFYFSSEAKALLAVLPETRKFDPKGVGEFLTCGCTLGNQSLYADIRILPPASMMLFEQGEVRKKSTYFDCAQWIDQERLDENQLSSKIIESFCEITKRYLSGSSPVGISLTGGLDSRIVMSCLDTSSNEIPCYSFGSMYRDTFDVETARDVARACGQKHNTLVLGEDFLRHFPSYLEKAVYISDGFIGMSGAAELFVNSMARMIAPVRLTGNYGGELLRGHRAFKCQYPHGKFISADLHAYLRDAQRTFQEYEATDAVTFALFKQAPSQGYGRLAIERSQVIPRTPFMDNDLVKLVYQAPPQVLKTEDLSVGIISRYNPKLLEIPTDRGMLGTGPRLGGMIRQLNRAALIKAEYYSSHGMPNWLAAISHYGIGNCLEKNFIGRNKFQHFSLWTRKYFATYISDVLRQGSEDLRELFNWRQVESMVREHVAGRQNYTEEIDQCMTLALGYRTLFKNAPVEISDKNTYSLRSNAISVDK